MIKVKKRDGKTKEYPRQFLSHQRLHDLPPAPSSFGRRKRKERRGACRHLDLGRRSTRDRSKRPRRILAVVWCQLRRRHRHFRKIRQRSALHFDPHGGIRLRRSRHEARARSHDARHSPTFRIQTPQSRRRRHHPHRRGSAPGDILVGKVTPKGETQLTPEERLLHAIFGEKAKDVKDTSLRMEGGKRGRVIGVKVFSRETATARKRRHQARARRSRAAAHHLRRRQARRTSRQQRRHLAHLPEEDMPFDENGDPVDIILTPLGVPSV
jgi:hypothetical protein